MDGKIENKKYFIMNAKIYARRYATDCFSDYFNDMAKKSGAGLDDYRDIGQVSKESIAKLPKVN